MLKYYSFFEAFPLVYTEIYDFNLGLVATSYLCILVCCTLGVCTYTAYLWFYLEPNIKKYGLGVQENWLRPAMAAVFLPTIGLFLFAWTSRADIHWIVSVIGITIYGFGVFIMYVLSAYLLTFLLPCHSTRFACHTYLDSNATLTRIKASNAYSSTSQSRTLSTLLRSSPPTTSVAPHSPAAP